MIMVYAGMGITLPPRSVLVRNISGDFVVILLSSPLNSAMTWLWPEITISVAVANCRINWPLKCRVSVHRHLRARSAMITGPLPENGDPDEMMLLGGGKSMPDAPAPNPLTLFSQCCGYALPVPKRLSG